jgi:hypothetical protein
VLVCVPVTTDENRIPLIDRSIDRSAAAVSACPKEEGVYGGTKHLNSGG